MLPLPVLLGNMLCNTSSTRHFYEDRMIYSHTRRQDRKHLCVFPLVCVCVCEKGWVQGTSSALCEVMGELKWRGGEVRPLGLLGVS